MSLDNNARDATSGLTEYFSIKSDKLKIQTNYSGDKVKYINYDANGIKVRTFLEGLIENENVLDLLTVLISEEGIFDAFVEKAIDQYGPPTIVSNTKTHFWCEVVNTNQDGCEFNFAVLRISNQGTKNEVYATLWKKYVL